MYLKKSKSNGRVYLSIVQGYRYEGKVKQKTIEKLGYLDELKKEFDDPIAHFQAIINSRNKESSTNKQLTIDLCKKLPAITKPRKNLGYVVAKKSYKNLGLSEFFLTKQASNNITYDLNGIFSLMVYNRVLFTNSKQGAFDRKHDFFENYSFSLNETYDSFAYFKDYSDEIQGQIYKSLKKKVSFANKTAYYTVSNFYFDTPHDESSSRYVNFSSKTETFSIPEKGSPNFQLGLLSDSNGLPVYYELLSEDDIAPPPLTARIKKLKEQFDLDKIILVAEHGISNDDYKSFLSGYNEEGKKHNDGYIFSQTIKGGSSDFQNWATSTSGFNSYFFSKKNSENPVEEIYNYKSRIIAKNVPLPRQIQINTNENQIAVKQKQVVIFNNSSAQYQVKLRNKLLFKALDIVSKPEKYKKDTCGRAILYVKNIKFNLKTGEISNPNEISINLERAQLDSRFDGHYAIATSETSLPEKVVGKIYASLREIETAFKLIKRGPKAQPVFIHANEHVRAHFIICFVSYLLLKITQNDLGGNWSIMNVRESLKSYCCSYLSHSYYLFDYRAEIIERIEEVYGFDFSKRIMSETEITKITK